MRLCAMGQYATDQQYYAIYISILMTDTYYALGRGNKPIIPVVRGLVFGTYPKSRIRWLPIMPTDLLLTYCQPSNLELRPYRLASTLTKVRAHGIYVYHIVVAFFKGMGLKECIVCLKELFIPSGVSLIYFNVI